MVTTIINRNRLFWNRIINIPTRHLKNKYSPFAVDYIITEATTIKPYLQTASSLPSQYLLITQASPSPDKPNMVIKLDKTLSKAMNATIMGSGDETIVLGHGFGTDQSLWDKVIPSISDKYKVVLFDWCFSGAIKDPDFFDGAKHTSYEAFAQDLVGLMEELKLESCTYMGHSMACMIGCIASTKRPQLFKKLVLVGASPRYTSLATRLSIYRVSCL